jgi:FdhD protein
MDDERGAPPERFESLEDASMSHRVDIVRWPEGVATLDVVALEEPLEIVIGGEPIAVLLRTPAEPADDLSLVAGFLLAEGVIEARDDLTALRHCEDPKSRGNRVLAHLAPGVRLPDTARRGFVASASCGLCGKRSIEAIAQRIPVRDRAEPPRYADLIAMDGKVRALQRGFAETGAIHAAALFARSTSAPVDVAEDVGRHNAVDRVMGRALLADRVPLVGHTLWVSGRTSFELVQKALIGGCDALVSVGAPTSLAVDLARTHGLHLVGFARGERLNVYAGAVSP